MCKLSNFMKIHITFVLIWIFSSTATDKDQKLCPIGFNLTYSSATNLSLCYRLKEPETFEELHNECTNNLYNLKFLQKYSVNITEVEFWTQYSSIYPGGELYFSDDNYSCIPDDVKKKTKYDSLSLNKTLCLVVVFDGHGEIQYITTDCTTKRYRYCVIDTYSETSNSCEDNKYEEFWSPEPICLFYFKDNINFDEAQKRCLDDEAAILHRGRLYANHPNFQVSSYPLANNDNNKISLIAAMINNKLQMVPKNYTFDGYICEKPLNIKTINTSLSFDANLQKIKLRTSETIPEELIRCYTDSLSAPAHHIVFSNKTFEAMIGSSGYYWCLNTFSSKFKINVSGTWKLYLETKNVSNVYAVKLRMSKRSNHSGSDFIYSYDNQEKYLKDLVNSNYKSGDTTSTGMFDNFKFMRSYIDQKTILLHVPFASHLKPLAFKSTEGEFELISIRNVYYCKIPSSNQILPADGSLDLPGCRTYHCEGDYNEGVELTDTATEDCTITKEFIKNRQKKEMQKISDELIQLLNHDSGPVYAEDLEEPLDKVNNIFQNEVNLSYTGELRNLLNQIGNKIDLNGKNYTIIVKHSIALVAAEAKPYKPIKGLIVTNNLKGFSIDNFVILTDKNSSQITDNTDAAVYLPDYVANSTRRISFVVFRTGNGFESILQQSINSKIISVNVENISKFQNNEGIDVILRPITEESRHRRTCGFWQQSDQDEYWSEDGCEFMKSTPKKNLDTCHCKHLTNFAEFLIHSKMSLTAEKVLEVISIVGCVTSLIGLFIICATACLFRSWRRDFINKIWLNLCFAIFLLIACFLIVSFSKFNITTTFCRVAGVTMHYAVLASSFWTLVAAILSYRKLVLIFSTDFSHKLLKAVVFAWGTPAMIIFLFILISPQSYTLRFKENSFNGSFCYPSGLSLFLTVRLPILIILIINTVLFILIIRSVIFTKRISRIDDKNKFLSYGSAAFTLTFLFGLPWYFGLFPYFMVGAYLFTITTSFQGFFLFIFFVAGAKKTRELWFSKLKIKSAPKPSVTYHTYLSS